MSRIQTKCHCKHVDAYIMLVIQSNDIMLIIQSNDIMLIIQSNDSIKNISQS